MDIKIPKKGDIVEGKVVRVEPNTVYINLFAPTEGKIDLANYGDPNLDTFEGFLNIGDVVKAKVHLTQFDDNPVILLSRLDIIKDENFEKILKIQEEQKVVKAKVKRVLEKGLLLNYKNHELFMPLSHLDYNLIDKKDELKGETLEVIILEVTKQGRRSRIIASRKKIIEDMRKLDQQQYEENRQKEIDNIVTGDVLKGTVQKIVNYGVFVKFDLASGLLRKSQISHHLINKIEDHLTVGQEVEVKVIKKENNKIDLSMKALIDTPFDKWLKSNHVGQEVKGVVDNKLPFGTIIELAEGVKGLLHKSEYTWNPNDNFEAYIKHGDEMDLIILAIDPKKERVSLSRKQLKDNPWKNVNVKRGDVVKGLITEVLNDSILVEIQGVNAVIEQRELSHDKIGKVEDYFNVGDEVEAIVIDVSVPKWILKLSIAKLESKQLRESYEKYLTDEEDDHKITLGDLIEEDLE